MTRDTAVTVCIATGDDRRVTRQFLARLAESLGPHDNVLLLGSGTPDPTNAAAWRVVGAGQDLRRPIGDAPARTRPAVVFVEECVELPSDWLDVLVQAAMTSDVAAVAPRTNAADGDELLIGIPYRPDEAGLRRTFTRDRTAARAAEISEARTLAGPCLALRRDVLESLGGISAVLPDGWDPAALARACATTGGRLVIAEGCYLHHVGGMPLRPDPRGASLPFISACLIVKDEEAELPTCLASLEGIADEIVVYDTGSTDRTIAIAEAAGATVLRGYWDDDFGRARNDALAHCRGQWIAWVDADESLVCEDPDGLRRTLRSLSTELEAYVVIIENQQGTKAGSTFTHPACRLFRRAYGHWEGHLHELVRARDGAPELARQLSDAVRITHRGYLQSHLDSRGKGARNLRTAFGDLAGGSNLPFDMRLVSLGRSYTVAGRVEEGLDLLRRALEVTELSSTVRLALRSIINALVVLGRIEEALVEVERLRAISKDHTLCDALEGIALLARGEPERALALFEEVGSTIDEDGFEYSAANVAVPRADALRALDRPSEAADVLLASIRESGGVDAHVGTLIECLEGASRDLGEIYSVLGPERAEHFVPQLLQLQPPVADRTLEAWLARDPGSARLLAAASRVALRLEIPRQLIWSSRLREAGFALACPLVASATDEATTPTDRVLAAAVAVAMFDDGRARQAFGAALLATPQELRDELGVQVGSIAPALAPVFAALSAGPAPARLDEARDGTRILVVDRELASLRTAGLAGLLASHGHRVTVLQPLPADSSTALLEPVGVTVRGWHDPADEGTGWKSACEQALARCTAADPFDAVVVRRSAADVLPAIRRLLPLATVALDMDGHSGHFTSPVPVDLVLSSTAAKGVPGVSNCGATAHDVLNPVPIPPLEARVGLCIAGNLRLAPDGVAEAFAGELVPALATTCGRHPIAVLGDDPSHLLATALPSAIVAGALADPTPWFASARLVLVTHEEAAEHWLDAAAYCGTPALVVPSDAARSGEVVAAVGALLADDALWRQFAPAAPSAPDRHDDPLAAVEPTRAPSTPRPRHAGGRPEVRIVGGAYGYESLAQMNRELVTQLVSDKPPFEVTIETREREPFPKDTVRALARVRVLRGPTTSADVEIRHQWPPDFSPARRGALVIWQPWEFGGLPAEWIAPLRDVAAELWVPTTWQLDCAVRSGLDASRVHIVPYGVDVERFRPEGRPYPLRTRKGTKLLFVGGLIERKGIDALLETYLSTFGRDDDVCLVVKPFGAQSVYKGSTVEDEVRAAAASDGPEIEVIDGDLDFEQMAALYRSCDALIHPYRGEGFGMPIAEAMASGLPVVVPNGGACLDFCDADNAWLIRAREVPILSNEWTPTKAGSWWLEPSRASLADALRAIVADPETAKRKGANGRQRIVEAFTWQHVAARATERVTALLAERPGETNTAPTTPRDAKEQR